jgi:hypothetical protein
MGAPDRQHILSELFRPGDEDSRRAVVGRLLPQPLPIDQPAGNHKYESRQDTTSVQAPRNQYANTSSQTDTSAIWAVFRLNELLHGICHSYLQVRYVALIAYRQLHGKLDTKCKISPVYFKFVVKNNKMA